MNNRDIFRRLMHQGHGRCALMLAENDGIEQYRDIVLEGCLTNFAFDAQCEGTRAEYVFRLAQFFPHAEYFALPAADAFMNLDETWGWNFRHLTELLTFLAKDGDTGSYSVLRKKYAELKEILLKKKDFAVYDRDRDHFNCLAESRMMLDGINGFLEAAEDIGNIIAVNRHYTGWDFELFDFDSKRIFGKDTIENLLISSASEKIKIYRDSIAKALEECRTAAEAAKNQPQQRRPEKREKEYDIDALIGLLYSSEPEYEDGFGSGHHSAVSSLLDAHEQGMDVPDEVLYRIYETTLCSCCRYKAVQFLAGERKLSKTMIRECKYDCNERTRMIADEYAIT